MRTWTKEEIKELLINNDAFMCRALMVLYSFQTADEQIEGEANHRNGAGFTGADARILTSFAQFYNNNGYLSPKQKDITRRKIIKYANQLANYANDRSK